MAIFEEEALWRGQEAANPNGHLEDPYGNFIGTARGGDGGASMIRETFPDWRHKAIVTFLSAQRVRGWQDIGLTVNRASSVGPPRTVARLRIPFMTFAEERQMYDTIQPQKRARGGERIHVWRELATDLIKKHPHWDRLQVARAIQASDAGRKPNRNFPYSISRILGAVGGLHSKRTDNGSLRRRRGPL
jgi:hypothetical protein